MVCVGDMRAERDFTDVRDVVRAYGLLLEKAKAGEAYNVASGKATSVRQIVRLLMSFSSGRIGLSAQRQRLRPGDMRTLYGEQSQIAPRHGLEARVQSPCYPAGPLH